MSIVSFNLGSGSTIPPDSVMSLGYVLGLYHRCRISAVYLTSGSLTGNNLKSGYPLDPEQLLDSLE